VRFFIIACLTCLILGIAFSGASLSIPIAHAQACLPDISATATPEATPQPSSASIVINEVLLLPIQAPLYCTTPFTTQAQAPQLPAGPWIELYNTLTQPLQLVHASLDSGPNTNAFTLTNTSIPAQSFIVAFPSTNNAFISTFTSTLRLMLNGSVLDQIVLPISSLTQDTSYARIPDGSSSWQITPNPSQTTTTTIGQSNNPIIAKATPQPQKTSTVIAKQKSATKTPTSNQTSKQTQQSSSTASNTSTIKPQVTQVQPNWKLVRLPTQIAKSTPTATPTSPNIANTILSPNAPDLPKKIIASLLVIALAFVLWWCRKLFLKT
jgi:hypothetical protein